MRDVREVGGSVGSLLPFPTKIKGNTSVGFQGHIFSCLTLEYIISKHSHILWMRLFWGVHFEEFLIDLVMTITGTNYY